MAKAWRVFVFSACFILGVRALVTGIIIEAQGSASAYSPSITVGAIFLATAILYLPLVIRDTLDN